MDLSTIIRPEVIDWLLEQTNPSIRFWALQHLQNKSINHKDVLEAQEALMHSPVVKAILTAQKPGGHWENPESMYLPKYKATTHSLLIIAELGVKKTPAVERGLEYIFSCQRNSGHFLTNRPKTERGRASTVTDGCCLDGNILYYMVHFNYLEDYRVQRLIQFLIEDHSTKNGGWSCRAYPIKPDLVFPSNCYMGATKVLRAFSMIPPKYRPQKMKTIIDQEVGIILNNRILRYLRTSDGSRKDKAGWKRFGFPLFYQSDVLEVLDTLTRLNVRDDRMQDAIDLVLSKQGSDGKWLLRHTFNGKMWHDIEVKGKPSKWITLRALRVLNRDFRK